MAVTLNKANLVLKDANGNIGKIEQLSNRDLAKIKTAVSDVALVVNQSNHTPIEATTTNKGVVQLATSADVASGASNKVVTAEQLHDATIGIIPAIATSTTLGVVKPDNDTITIDSNGVLTATKAIHDKNGAQIDTTYFKSAYGTFTGPEYYRDVNNSILRFNGGNTHDGGASLILIGKNKEDSPGVFDLVACTKEDASDSKQLIGTPAGSLTWAGHEVERVELKNGNYIRFTSGLTLMWGALEIPGGTKIYTVNLPIPFKSNYQVFLSNLGSDRVSSIETISYRVDKTSLSAFNIEHTFGNLTGWSYFAVGY